MRSAPAADSNEFTIVRMGDCYCHLAWLVLFIVCISVSASALVSATWCVKSTSLQIYTRLLQLLDDLEPPIQLRSQPVAASSLAWRSCILNQAHSAITNQIAPSNR
jgi:hypothetical protein